MDVLSLPGPWDYVGWWLLVSEKILHGVHVWGDVAEEHPVSFAEGVQTILNPYSAAAFLAGLTGIEAMLGAFSVAGEQPFAAKASGREFVSLIYAEGHLLVRTHHFSDGFLSNVAKKVVLVYEVVTRVEVPVVLYYGIAAASLSKNATSWHHSDPVGQRSLEIRDEDSSDIIPYPEIEYVAEKSSVAYVAD